MGGKPDIVNLTLDRIMTVFTEDLRNRSVDFQVPSDPWPTPLEFCRCGGLPTIRPECELGLGACTPAPLPLVGAPHIRSLWEF